MADKNGNLAIIYDDDASITLGALGANTAIIAASKVDANRSTGFRVMRTEYAIGYHSKTANEGGIIVGLAAGLTAAEITDALVADPQRSDEIGNETAKRPIWPLMFIPFAATGDEPTEPMLPLRVLKPKWSIPEGENLVWFAYAQGALTTGTVIEIFAKHFGVWLRD